MNDTDTISGKQIFYTFLIILIASAITLSVEKLVGMVDYTWFNVSMYSLGYSIGCFLALGILCFAFAIVILTVEKIFGRELILKSSIQNNDPSNTGSDYEMMVINDEENLNLSTQEEIQ